MRLVDRAPVAYLLDVFAAYPPGGYRVPLPNTAVEPGEKFLSAGIALGRGPTGRIRAGHELLGGDPFQRFVGLPGLVGYRPRCVRKNRQSGDVGERHTIALTPSDDQPGEPPRLVTGTHDHAGGTNSRSVQDDAVRVDLVVAKLELGNRQPEPVKRPFEAFARPGERCLLRVLLHPDLVVLGHGPHLLDGDVGVVETEHRYEIAGADRLVRPVLVQILGGSLPLVGQADDEWPAVRPRGPAVSLRDADRIGEAPLLVPVEVLLESPLALEDDIAAGGLPLHAVGEQFGQFLDIREVCPLPLVGEELADLLVGLHTSILVTEDVQIDGESLLQLGLFTARELGMGARARQHEQNERYHNGQAFHSNPPRKLLRAYLLC